MQSAAAKTPDTASAQSPQKPAAKILSPSPELAGVSQQIQDLASSVPPELAAYALLKVEEAKGVGQPEQVQLIESAYNLAAQSPYPIRLTSAGNMSDTRATFLAYALDLDLDTLSLRTEAVMDMLKLDPERARDLFQQMRPLTLKNLSCSDALLYAPSAYYRTAAAIYNQGFSQDEQAKGLSADFLESIFREVSHAGEVGPAADLLRTQQLDTETLARMQAAFARAISNIRGDYRSFAGTQGSFVAVLSRLGQTPGRASRALLEGARVYLVANYSGEQCAANTASNTALLASSATTPNAGADPFPALNRVFLRNDIKPVSAAELAPSSIDSKNQNSSQAYWTSPVAKQILFDGKALRSSSDAGDKSSLQWQERAEAFLMELRGWTDASSEPSSEDFYIEKAVSYSDMLALTPVESPVYDEAMNAYVAFLSEQPPSDYVRIFQLWSIHSLVQSGRRDRSNSEAVRKKLEAAIHASPNPSIALYGYLLTLERMQGTQRRFD